MKMPDEEVVEEEVKEEEVKEPEGDTLSEVEQLAQKIGWNPNHEEGDRKFVSAEDYILRSKEIQTTQSKQARSLKREMETMKNGLKMLEKHNNTVYQVQLKALRSRIGELEGHRKNAVEDGDTAAVTAIDTQIKEIRDIPEELPQTEPLEPSKEYIEWEEKNPWYSENKEMRQYADYQGENNPEFKALPLSKVFAEITKLVKKRFPENFPEEKAPEPKPRVAAVEGGGVKTVEKSKSKSKYGYKDLSREQQDACDFFVKNVEGMTRERYIEELEMIEANKGRV
jgi:hypothetical protein